MHSLDIETRTQNQFIDITARVTDLVRASGVENGLCAVYVPHTTAGVTINENADPDVSRDMLAALARIVPENGGYHHREGNSPAHVKASLMGPSLVAPIVDGRLALGTWQGIYFCEFDGPRRRRVFVQIVGE